MKEEFSEQELATQNVLTKTVMENVNLQIALEMANAEIRRLNEVMNPKNNQKEGDK